MSLKPCRECSGAIAAAANPCPHCGAKHAGRGRFVHALHEVSNFAMKLGLLITVLYIAVALAGCSTVRADDHKHVAWDALEPGKAYMIRTEVRSHMHYLPVRAGVVRFPGGGFFKVYECVVHEGALWYLTKWLKPRSMDPNDNIKGWVKAAELRAHGAYIVRGYD